MPIYRQRRQAGRAGSNEAGKDGATRNVDHQVILLLSGRIQNEDRELTETQPAASLSQHYPYRIIEPSSSPNCRQHRQAAGAAGPLPRAPQDVGEGAGRGDPGGLGRRRLDPARRRPGAGDGPGRDQQKHRQQAVQGHRRPGQCVPRPPRSLVARPLVGDWPYLWLDATYLKQREGGRSSRSRR